MPKRARGHARPPRDEINMSHVSDSLRWEFGSGCACHRSCCPGLRHCLFATCRRVRRSVRQRQSWFAGQRVFDVAFRVSAVDARCVVDDVCASVASVRPPWLSVVNVSSATVVVSTSDDGSEAKKLIAYEV